MDSGEYLGSLVCVPFFSLPLQHAHTKTSLLYLSLDEKKKKKERRIGPSDYPKVLLRVTAALLCVFEDAKAERKINALLFLRGRINTSTRLRNNLLLFFLSFSLSLSFEEKGSKYLDFFIAQPFCVVVFDTHKSLVPCMLSAFNHDWAHIQLLVPHLSLH